MSRNTPSLRPLLARPLLSFALLVAAPLAVELGHVAPAAADDKKGPDPSKSPASDDIMLTQGALRGLEKKLADSADWGTNKDARESARTSIQSVEAGLGRIKKNDPKWNTSDMEKTLKAAKERLKKADDQVQKQEGDAEGWRKAYREYVDIENKLDGTLKFLDQMQSKPNDVQIDSEQGYRGSVADIAAVEQLDNACKAKGFGKLKQHPEYKTVVAAELGCRLAASWKQLGTKYVEIQVKGGAKREADRLDKAVEKVKRGEPISAQNHGQLLDPKGYIESLKKQYEEPAKAFGAPVDAAWLDAINGVATKYPAALAEAAKTSRWDSTAKIQDGAATALFAAAHGKGGEMPAGKVLKVAAFADWSVDKDAFGTPVSRERDVQVLVQVSGESYCRVYGAVVKASYKGGWSAPFTMGGGATIRISACK